MGLHERKLIHVTMIRRTNPLVPNQTSEEGALATVWGRTGFSRIVELCEMGSDLLGHMGINRTFPLDVFAGLV